MFTVHTPQTRRPPTDLASLDPWLLWRLDTPDQQVILSIAELAECACPELCDRDHANE